MANISAAQGIYLPNFIGGVNESVDEALIKYNECKAMQNCDIDKGVLSTSLGTSKYTVATLPRIETIMTYYKDNVGYILASCNDKLYRLDNDTFTEIGSGFTSDLFDYINFNINVGDVLIFGNGVDNTKLFDGTTIRDLKHDGSASVDSDTNKAPKVRFIELHYERVWGAGDKDNPDRLYFSTANTTGFDPDDWTFPTTEGEANQHGGFIEMPTNDGGNIIGLKVIFDDIVIFKKNNIFKIFGTNPSNYSKTQIFSANGGIADKTIVAGNNRAYFVAKDGIYMYDGTNVAPISAKIRDTFDTINKTYIDKSVGIFYKNHYILAVPEGDSTLNNLIIDFDTMNSSYKFVRGITVNSFAIFNDRLIYSDNNGNLCLYEDGNDFNGTPIVSFWETGFKDLGAQDATKLSQYIYFVGHGNGQVKFICTTDKKSKEIIIPLTQTDIPYRKQLKNKGRLVNLRIENVDGSSFTIKNPKLTCEFDFD